MSSNDILTKGNTEEYILFNDYEENSLKSKNKTSNN